MKCALLVVPLAAALLLSACADFQRRPYRYTRVYPHQQAAREKILATRVTPDPALNEPAKAPAAAAPLDAAIPLVPGLPQ